MSDGTDPSPSSSSEWTTRLRDRRVPGVAGDGRTRTSITLTVTYTARSLVSTPPDGIAHDGNPGRESAVTLRAYL